MVVLSLLLKPRVNRIINIVVSVLYIITIIGSAIGETWAYYVPRKLIEVILLVAPNRLEMAATSDRTLAAIGNQRAQPASRTSVLGIRLSKVPSGYGRNGAGASRWRR